MFDLPKLPYEYNALEPFIDETTMNIHHTKHHAAYIKNMNDLLSSFEEYKNKSIEDLMGMLDSLPAEISTKVRNNAGGHFNHSLFWKLLSPIKDMAIEDPLKSAVVKTFGNIESFKEQFTQSAMGRFGSGWVWLTVENGNLIISDTANQDNPLMQGKSPILGLDVWEHAYYLKYQNRRADYVAAFWHVVAWDQVNKLLQQA